MRDDLLKLISDNVAEKVLSCLGNSDRLNILLALLKKAYECCRIDHRMPSEFHRTSISSHEASFGGGSYHGRFQGHICSSAI